MIMCDVNVFVYAFKQGSPRHEEYRAWLDDAINADRPFGLSDLVLSGFLRVVTHPRVFENPSSWPAARSFVDLLRSADNAVPITPGPRHWAIFASLVEASGAIGNALPDAFLAALAVESGSEWVTADRGFARYPGLRWRHPLGS